MFQSIDVAWSFVSVLFKLRVILPCFHYWLYFLKEIIPIDFLAVRWIVFICESRRAI